MIRHSKLIIVICFILIICAVEAITADFATEVISYSNLMTGYDNADAVLGMPSTVFTQADDKTFHCSIVLPAWNDDPPTLDLVASILKNGHIIVKFDEYIYDDPLNWYGKDFIIFGNSKFRTASTGFIEPTTNMETYYLNGSVDVIHEPMHVSVSQDGLNWFEYTEGPFADSYAPMQAYAWDWVNHTWGSRKMDITRPVDPSIPLTEYAGKSVAEAIDLYKGSAGGTSFDLNTLQNLPVDPISGRKWIQYIKVSADITYLVGTITKTYQGEIDSFMRVGHKIDSISIGQAKQLPDDAHVILNEAVVSSGTNEVGPYCYIEHTDHSGGIKIMGRALDRGKTVTLYGDMDTIDGERVVQVTGIETGEDSSVTPVGMPNKSIGGGDFFYHAASPITGQKGTLGGTGLNNIGSLVRTWGRVKSVNSMDKIFVINDGSGHPVECIAPPVTPPATYTLPGQDIYVKVTGISSCKLNDQQELVPVLRLRDENDWNEVPE